MNNLFVEVRELDEVAKNILNKRYFQDGETEWKDIVKRVIDNILINCTDKVQKQLTYDMLLHRYFLPNSPTLVNAGRPNGGLNACYVMDFQDSIEEIYKTKLECALVTRKGGGCGISLSKLRPEGSKVNGSVHGYAGGPVKFFDTICHDLEVLSQAGFRESGIMGVMSIYHPDIVKFIMAKTDEGKLRIANISVMVDDYFMRRVENNETYWTIFNEIKYEKLYAKDVFNKIVDGAWKNGEPGLLFYDKINNTPYKYSNQAIDAVNLCGEQPLPSNGVCNLGSLDISKFLTKDKVINLSLLELAIRLSMRFLDGVIDVNSYPTKDIERWAKNNRSIGLGIMGLADLFLELEIEYGSLESIKHTEFIMSFIAKIAEDESIILGKEFCVPKCAKNLPTPRRNVTLLSIAPTGTLSILAGCSNGIEPIFSEITERKDKTGTYILKSPKADLPYFKCAVSINGAKEVTWKEHIDIQNASARFVDSGVSKTINLPNYTHKETVYDAFMYAWKSPYVKGVTVYRSNSREKEVLSPKFLKKDLCPLCGKNLISEGNCKHCSNCEFSICDIS